MLEHPFVQQVALFGSIMEQEEGALLKEVGWGRAFRLYKLHFLFTFLFLSSEAGQPLCLFCLVLPFLPADISCSSWWTVSPWNVKPKWALSVKVAPVKYFIIAAKKVTKLCGNPHLIRTIKYIPKQLFQCSNVSHS